MVENYMQKQLWAYKQRKEKTDAEYASKQSAQMENDTMTLYKGWLEATDEDTKKKYHVASRANLLAEMISNKAKEKWVELTWNAKDIVSSYLKGFPDDYQKLTDFTHGNQDPEEFAIEMWWMEKPEVKSNFFTNVTWGAYDSATWIPRMIGKWAANAIWWVAKQFWADEDKVNELVQSYKDYLDSDWSAKAIGADTDSGTYKVSKVVSDIAQTAALWKLGGMAVESKLWMPLATSTDPLRAKALAWATEWAADMWIYSAVSESKLPSGSDLALWAGLWAAFPVAWAAVKWIAKTVAPRLQLKWIITPKKLSDISKKMIREEGEDLASAGLKSPADVWQYLLDREIKWTEAEMVQQLRNNATKSRNLKLEELWKSTRTYDIPSVDTQLETLYNTAKNTPWLEADAARWEELIANKWRHTLLEADEVNHAWGEYYKLYKPDWSVMDASAKKTWLANLRRETKEFIENAAKSEWLWNIKMLNNETMISNQLADGIASKEASNVVSDLLKNYVPWGIAGSVTWPFDNSTPGGKIANFLLGALWQRISTSAAVKTNLASKLNKMSWGTKKELERWISGEVKSISKEAEAEFRSVLEAWDIAELLMIWAAENLND